MPIYAYRCDACGHAKDVLQKISEPVLTVCPSCGAPAFRKQVTAAGFQLKGSGWYVTDFRGGQAAGDPAKTATAPASAPKTEPAGSSDAPAASPAPAAPSAPAAAPAASGGSSSTGGQ